MAVKTYLITKEITTEAKKADIKQWESELNDSFETWDIKKIKVVDKDKVEKECC